MERRSSALRTCLVVAIVASASCGTRDEQVVQLPPEAMAKVSPGLYSLLDPSVEADVRQQAAIVRALSARSSEDVVSDQRADELAAAASALLLTSPSLHPRDQLLGDEPMLTIFVDSINLGETRRAVEQSGGVVLVEATTMMLVRIPYSALRTLPMEPSVKSLEADTLGELALDASIPDVNADDVQVTGTPPYTAAIKGEGVVIGVVDTGVDFKHQDLRRSTGETRLLSYWDPCFTPAVGVTGISPDGKEYSAADINSELATPGSVVPERDTAGHGTNVAAIAASDGSATGAYAGVAPAADIIAVGDVTACPTPTGLTQPLIGLPFGTSRTSFDAHIVQGIDYVFKRARAAGKPAVVNISAGNVNIGAHDGTSSLEKMIDQLSGPGHVVVISAGNEARGATGTTHVHDSGSVAAGATLSRGFNQLSGTSGLMDLWFENGDELCVGITTPGGSTLGPYGPSAGGPFGACPPAPCASPVAIPGGSGTFSMCFGKDPNNSDWEAAIKLSGPSLTTGNYTLDVFANSIGGAGGKFNVWTSSTANTRFITGDETMTVQMPCTAKRAICVGSYVTKSPLSGDTLYGLRQTTSRGPSRDPSFTGRKPTITAPGHVIASAHSADCSTASGSPCDTTLTCVTCVETGSCEHIGNCGSSMAAPHVAGTVALMLQAAPWMGPEEVTQIITSTPCTSQGACGSCTVAGGCPSPYISGLPNDDWGFGKINTLAAVTEAAHRSATGFPTNDPNDGKIVDVVGSAPVTIPQPLLTLFIQVPGGPTPDINLQIFDGDLGGAYDSVVGPTTTYFTLYADPLETCGSAASGAVIAQKTDTFFADSAYTTFYSGHDASALNASTGTYHYRLEVALNSPSTPDILALGMNGFKVRVTQPAGQLGARLVNVCAPFQFIAADLAPPPPDGWASPSPFLSGGVDTSYDGVFDFYIDVPNLSSTYMKFYDADADDTSSPAGACATGANSAINYTVIQPNGQFDYNQDVVSGDFSSCTGMASEDLAMVPYVGAGFYRWHWAELLTENQVYIRQPTPAMSFNLEMKAGPYYSLPVSASKGMGYWRNTSDDLSVYLPITLGLLDGNGDPLGQTVVVTTDAQARQVLTRGGPRVNPGTRAVRNLLSQLLACKLNMALDATNGIDLAASRIYGSDFFVGDIVAQAKDALAAIDDPTLLTAAERAHLNELQDLLDTANSGRVTFLVDPTVPTPVDPPAPAGTPNF